MEKRRKGHRISQVDPGSIGEEMGLAAGDWLLAVNGREIEDIFDYEYYVESPAVTLLVEKASGEEWELEIENEGEDLGLSFENGLMSQYRSCCNKCIFCFIDQMPPGMRETLYFKDDDSRLSFLQGNYITLTNMKEKDIERIIRFKLAPVNISVHTTNRELRCRMLNNRFAGRSLQHMDRLFEARIPMNGQIVLCPDINDREELERTIGDLAAYIPCMESLSVVPVGLTKFRDGLTPLRTFTREEACQVIDQIEGWQKRMFEKHGTHFVHASDEFYILAQRPLPEAERYDGYIQLENGVGMLRLLEEEASDALSREISPKEGESGQAAAGSPPAGGRKISLATGQLAGPYIRGIAQKVGERFPDRAFQIFEVKNEFFGPRITVSGLLTGRDIISQLKGRDLGEFLLLPENMFRAGEEVFLDDLTKADVEKALQVRIRIVKSSGYDLVAALLFPEREPEEREEEAWPGEDYGYEGYELNGNSSDGG